MHQDAAKGTSQVERSENSVPSSVGDVTEATQASSILAAGAKVMGLLPQVASWAIGLSCFAYLAGQRELSAYLGKLGAPWAMTLFSPTQLMQFGATAATTVVLFGFIAFRSLLQGTSERRLRQWSVGILVVAGLLLLASFPDQSAASKLRWVQASVVLNLASGGVTVGELVASLRQAKGWGLRQISLVDVIVFSALLGTSSLLGDARADADAVRGSSRLPVVSLAKGDTQPWRLVLSNGDKLLLMSPATAKEERQFKVVGIADAEAVMAN